MPLKLTQWPGKQCLMLHGNISRLPIWIHFILVSCYACSNTRHTVWLMFWNDWLGLGNKTNWSGLEKTSWIRDNIKPWNSGTVLPNKLLLQRLLLVLNDTRTKSLPWTHPSRLTHTFDNRHLWTTSFISMTLISLPGYSAIEVYPSASWIKGNWT